MAPSQTYGGNNHAIPQTTNGTAVPPTTRNGFNEIVTKVAEM